MLLGQLPRSLIRIRLGGIEVSLSRRPQSSTFSSSFTGPYVPPLWHKIVLSFYTYTSVTEGTLSVGEISVVVVGRVGVDANKYR